MRGVARFVLVLPVFLGLWFLAPPARAADESCAEWMGKVVSAQGSVDVRRAGAGQWTPAAQGQVFCPGDTIRVQARSRAALVLRNEGVLRLDQETTLTFSQVEERERLLLEILRGAAHFFSRRPRSLKVLTPFLNASVEGTEFFARVDGGESFLTVFEGRVALTNPTGSLNLTSGQSAIARAGEPPSFQLVVRPRDAVQWALYYAPVLDLRPEDYPGEAGTWQAAVRASIEALRRGDLAAAFAALEAAPRDVPDARFYLYRAGLLLRVGRVDEAKADNARALQVDPRSSGAYAVESIIAVAQNQKDQALGLAQKAVELDPGSAAPKVALSYAYQARFEIEKARESLQAAVAAEPQNSLARARLAEVWLMQGYSGKARDAAERAAALNPNLGRIQSVLGFASLAAMKTKEAEGAFRKGIGLDSADPLPRLGLGLATIRQGDLKGGRQELEIAASLDPGNSLIRSYLGKAFFEEKRDRYAARELEIAKQLDPLDPTPWFYDAIRKQTENRPVEALQDIQKSIELNDNRAVYRSRLLLDEDLAARSASLARIYSDLGFEQLALAEGFKSVNMDLANYSAHRFLAQAYAALPRHQIAQGSELLQAQLLQPVNTVPVQPHLAQPSMFIPEGAGPSTPAFNEFTPLFLRDRLALQVSGLVGERETWGDEATAFGLWGRYSLSVGQFHYETDGFRENNEQRSDIYNASFQTQLSPDASVQAEIRRLDSQHGDLVNTFTGYFRPDLNQEETIDTYRLGFRQRLGAGSTALISAIYQYKEQNTFVEPGFEIDTPKLHHYVADLAYIFSASTLSVQAGARYIGTEEESEIKIDTPFGLIEEVQRYSPEDIGGYIYSNMRNQWATLTIGMGFDDLDGSMEHTTQFSPKAGLSLRPFSNTQLRAAFFRTLQTPSISELDVTPSLEPTEVAGFNQFFSATEGVRATRYGFGADQKFASGLWGGAEFSRRELRVPFLMGYPLTVYHRQEDEWQGRAYLNWAAHDRLALTAEYLYERFKREAPDGATGPEQFAKLVTNRVPLGLRYYDPVGIRCEVTGTYVYQKGDFTIPTFSGYSLEPGSDVFWVFDASLSYRLPKRLGILSVEAKNLFDQEFSFQDTDPANPRILPGRLVLGRLTLSL